MAVMNPYNYKKPIGASNREVISRTTPTTPVVNSGNSKTDTYLEQRIMNARPEELTLMLYEGVIKFVKLSMIHNDQKNVPKSHESNLRAQAILQELRSTLNMDIAISANLENLYLFMMDRLVEANFQKSNDILQEVLDLAVDLRDTWKQAMNL